MKMYQPPTKEFFRLPNKIFQVPLDAESKEVSIENKEEAFTLLRPRFYGEEPVLKIPTETGAPPIVIQPKEPNNDNTTAFIKGIIGALTRLIGNKYLAHQQTLQGQIDHRLKQQINEKKLTMGFKIESTQKASYQTEEEYEQSM